MSAERASKGHAVIAPDGALAWSGIAATEAKAIELFLAGEGKNAPWATHRARGWCCMPVDITAQAKPNSGGYRLARIVRAADYPPAMHKALDAMETAGDTLLNAQTKEALEAALADYEARRKIVGRHVLALNRARMGIVS